MEGLQMFYLLYVNVQVIICKIRAFTQLTVSWERYGNGQDFPKGTGLQRLLTTTTTATIYLICMLPDSQDYGRFYRYCQQACIPRNWHLSLRNRHMAIKRNFQTVVFPIKTLMGNSKPQPHATPFLYVPQLEILSIGLLIIHFLYFETGNTLNCSVNSRLSTLLKR